MKTVRLTLILLTVCGSLGYAGSDYSGKEMKEAATAPICPSWTGFYGGVFGGYKFGVGDVRLDLTGNWPLTVFAPDEPLLESANSRDLEPSGPEVGGLIGYNYQFGNWVVGLEASAAFLWVDDSNHFENVGVVNSYDGDTSVESNYLVTVGPRLGYAFCKWMPYVTGGIAFGDIDFHQEFFIPATGGETAQGGSTHEDQVGWMVGGGLEYAISDHWRVRGQYQYVDLGCVDFDSVFREIGTPNPDFTGNHEASLREHNVTFALIYSF